MATLRSQFDNAPPALVLAWSSLMAQAVIDVLTKPTLMSRKGQECHENI